MRITAQHSHLNGLEFLLVHHPNRWQEIQDVIASVDAEECRIKKSKELRKAGLGLLYSPIEMNRAMKTGFASRKWTEQRTSYWVTEDVKLIRKTLNMKAAQQKAEIEGAGRRAIGTYNQTDFVKDRIAVEVQFGKYSFVAYDLFVKHMAFFVGDVIDVGVEILPMKDLQSKMSSGVGYYESELYNVIRQGRGVPAVPLVIVGVIP
ncbi:MAG: BglII/BstYI family type II restriction endonuclease [Candidatus Binataceae bacterium]